MRGVAKGDRPLVLLEEGVDRGMAAVAGAAGEAACGDLLDRGRAVLDLPAHAALADPVTQAHQRHVTRKAALTSARDPRPGAARFL